MDWIATMQSRWTSHMPLKWLHDVQGILCVFVFLENDENGMKNNKSILCSLTAHSSLLVKLSLVTPADTRALWDAFFNLISGEIPPGCWDGCCISHSSAWTSLFSGAGFPQLLWHTLAPCSSWLWSPPALLPSGPWTDCNWREERVQLDWVTDLGSSDLRLDWI